MDQKASKETRDLATGWWGVRYQVEDVPRSVEFYTQRLGLSGPGASGSRQMPNGVRQQPGGWNRIILQVNDLAVAIEALKKVGLPLRNAMESGPGGKQVQLEDPDGNPIELFEPAR
jgi:glyoxylase I family protein